ncbi:MAG: penicillin-binding protein activator [Gammaproteobacteria bacterium]|nr:penicillin-binding protein activator [Gammaproteobacteria bacterium]
MKHYFKLFALIGITLILSSCASKPGYSPDAVSEADQLYLSKQYAEAAIAFNQQATGAVGTEQALLVLRAVISYVKAEQLTQAVQLLHSLHINESILKVSNLARLTRAHIALAERNAEEVLNQLKKPLASNSPAIFFAEYHELRATAFSMQGDRITTAEEYILQGNHLTDDESKLKSQELIWESLALLTERSLQQLQPARAPDVLSGWMELVRISKKYQLNPTLLRASINNWQRRFVNHPVKLSLLEGLRNRKQEDVTLPENIALLLPLTGRFANPAKAIRDGLLASYYAKKDKENITIRIYDTKADPKSIGDIYEQAVSDGAQFVIGPLNKASIKELSDLDDLSVPTLALNYINNESSIPEELYQFGLSPEEEAIQVAERTWLDGHVNAAVLTPAGPWGDRVYKAFRDRWEQIGGRVVEQQSYNSSKNDFSLPIRKLLNIDESKTRYRKMSRLLRTKLKYTTYRRQDIDFIFIAGFPRQARQIRPQLKFFHASKVPVYATSHIYTGNLNTERDRDMDGIRFGDMPWVLTESTLHRGLRNEIEKLISKEGNKHQRLYAMGVDAFNIIAALNTLKAYPYERYQGETGSLSMDEKQRIKRQLSWVYFRSGRPRLLEQANQ